MWRLILMALSFLAVLVAAWTGYWFYAAAELRTAVLDWVTARRAEGATIIWDRFEVEGFPLIFRLRAEQVQLADSRRDLPWRARIPIIIAESDAWDLRRWRAMGERGLTARLDPAQSRPSATAQAASFDGAFVRADDHSSIELKLQALELRAEVPLTAAEAAVQVTIPEGDAVGAGEAGRATVGFRDLVLPERVGPLGRRIQRAAAAIRVKGRIPPGPAREALATWRDKGGTAELGAIALEWDKLTARAEGTLALDGDMQPIAAMTATVEGWEDILDALTAEGSMKQGDAVIARLALGLLAKPGAAGRSQITAPVTIQDSTLFIAKVRITRLPRLTWQ